MADPKNAFITAMVFLFALDLFAGVLVTTGVADTLGLGIQPSGTDDAEKIEKEFQDKQETGAATGETLFGLYNILGNSISKLGRAINPGIGILISAGAPPNIMNAYITPVVTVVKGIGVAYFLRGL